MKGEAAWLLAGASPLRHTTTLTMVLFGGGICVSLQPAIYTSRLVEVLLHPAVALWYCSPFSSSALINEPCPIMLTQGMIALHVLGGTALLLYVHQADGTLVGTMVIALALPPLWCKALAAARHLAQEVGMAGRVLGLSGLTVAVAHWLYVGALLPEETPITAALSCGALSAFGWFLAVLWSITTAVSSHRCLLSHCRSS
eukprot:SAG11_NODE_170_length_13624_cov_40.078226_2_plen_200_part_00